MSGFHTITEMIAYADENHMPLHAVVIENEVTISQRREKDILHEMAAQWEVMKSSIRYGIENEKKSISGLTGGDAKKLYTGKGTGYLGEAAHRAAAYAVGINEVSASMGRVVACPTAGSCGIVPAALYAAAETKQIDDETIVKALFTAAGIGMIIAQNASISGAEGGCQAECGTAAGMAAASLVELAGGTPEMSGNACALAIKNLLGLACDPVAGLVEVPCVKRNGFIAVEAMLAADMALMGVRSFIPVDEVIDAMYRIGKSLPKTLRETAKGGLATTPTALAAAKMIYGEA
ncbi:L-serine ammonia-lyase, iron-sulfur-dependent, subunit alpha [Selenomonas sp. TAMA-11512]|uniref:L-serine ammonia-lyase, iron-sulfur-dependent, subunit alpha n=1 Tax=Selenomonas sp. TAMA-11512 TaxID=3095337 RepID=UPI0030935998|nr:L-serine ammonia-lyase, iron-sulfur-dependent, subunit alpha [Selenomonas sp. TAMA-11512]